jgi:acetyl esterase/lipase
MDRQLMVNLTMTSEDFLGALINLPTADRPRGSRDGRWVAWVWYGIGAAADVYAAPTDGSAPPLRLTASSDDTFLVSWTADSRAVIVGQDHGGDERVRLFRVDLDRPLTMVPLTEANPGYYIQGGDLHPNGHWLVYGANLDPVTGGEIEPTYIFRHDLETGERRVLARPEKAGIVWPVLSPKGTHVLYTRVDRHPAGRQVWLVGIDGAGDREIANVGDDRKVFGFWFPDGERVLLLADADTHRRLGMWELESGRLRWLIDDPNRYIEAAYVPDLSTQIVVVESRHARYHASLLDWRTGIEVPVPDVPGNLVPLAPVGPQEWVGTYFSSRWPTDLVRFSLGARSVEDLISLTRVWEMTPLTPDDLVPAEDVRWRSTDGLEIQGWLYRPKGEARGTVVMVHGGPTYHSTDMLDAQGQYLVHQGFNVLDPNYRGSTGFSLPFREAIKEDGWGGREQEDICTGIETLMTRGIAEPGRVGITGTSYGGYSSWWAITHLGSDLAAAAAPVCGMTDLVVDYQTTRPDLRPYSAEMMGGTPEEVPERFYERSPIHRVDRIRARLLIVQGLRDPNVTPENVRMIQQGLERAGVPYELLAFEDEGHGITLPKNQRTLYVRLADFFERAFAGQGE